VPSAIIALIWVLIAPASAESSFRIITASSISQCAFGL
jgi:hypothetical protein